MPFDEAKYIMILSAAHCVAKPDAFGNVKPMPKFRLRLPLHPWKNFPEDTKEYQPGPQKTNHLYESIVISKEQIFVHEKYPHLIGFKCKITDLKNEVHKSKGHKKSK